MRVLLDEMLDRRLAGFLPEATEAVTVRERGWGAKKDGELLALAEEEFDVLLTADRHIPEQQDLSRFDLAVVILEAKSNRLADLAPIVSRAGEFLSGARPGRALRVGAEAAGEAR